MGEIFDEVDDQVNFWNEMMKGIVNDHLPVKRMRVRDKDIPCMTEQWKSAIRAKRKATAKYLKNKTVENWEHKQKCRNEATKQRRLAFKEYWRKKLEDLKTKPR